MRILRSQYMKYQAQQRLSASTATTTTTTVTQLHNETEVQHHQQSTHTYLTRAAVKNDLQSIQTVTKTTHTTVRRNSILPLENNTQATIYHRRNSTIVYSERPRSVIDTIQNTAATAIEPDSNNCINVIAQPMYIQQRRRQTVTCCTPEELIQQQVMNALKIKLINAPNKGYSRINVVVKFYDEGAAWYTRFYRSYQNVLWQKYPRENPTKKSKWYFKCEVCEKKLCSFSTLKGHLNIHMEFFPYRCGVCPKKYPASSSFTRHKKQKHDNKN